MKILWAKRLSMRYVNKEYPCSVKCGNHLYLTKRVVCQVGHWLGLEHPFYTVTGKSCDPQDKVWLPCIVRSSEIIASKLTCSAICECEIPE
jgi:hypothetical protein